MNFPASKLPQTATTIFTTMSALAQEHNAINLSQGFPDFDGPDELFTYAHEAMKTGHNQYAPMPGLPALRENIAQKTEKLYGAVYHPETEITVTAGATQAIFTAITSVVHPNDEVIIFEPAYDCYAPAVKLAGGIIKRMELKPPDYRIDWEMVKRLISIKTRLIILNSPQNPTGTTLKKEDIDALIRLTKNTDILILSDEVYEHMVYDGKPHQSLARFPELRERSFITASFGKLFHATGWKTGYCLAPAKLMAEFRKVHQFLVFSVHTPTQHAIARMLKQEDSYNELHNFFQQKRDTFRKLMAETSFKLLPCEGAYFQCVDYSGISKEKDTGFALRLIKENKVAAIPVSVFYSAENDYRILRFCFAKKQETLEEAVKRLTNFKQPE